MNYGIKTKKSLNIKRRRLSVEANRTISALMVTLSLLIVTLAASHIYLNSSSAQKAYRVSQLKEINNELKTNQDNFDSKLTDAISFSTIEEDSQVKKMAEPEVKEFVTP